MGFGAHANIVICTVKTHSEVCNRSKSRLKSELNDASMRRVESMILFQPKDSSLELCSQIRVQVAAPKMPPT